MVARSALIFFAGLACVDAGFSGFSFFKKKKNKKQEMRVKVVPTSSKRSFAPGGTDVKHLRPSTDLIIKAHKSHHGHHKAKSLKATSHATTNATTKGASLLGMKLAASGSSWWFDVLKAQNGVHLTEELFTAGSKAGVKARQKKMEQQLAWRVRRAPGGRLVARAERARS